LCTLLAACASAPAPNAAEALRNRLTREEILSSGTRRFDATAAQVYRAALSALATLGFEIASESPEHGVIVTTRRPIPPHEGSETRARQLVVRLFLDPRREQVVVSVQPKLFEDDGDVSEQPVWDIPGLRRLWLSLFAETDRQLR
jgi:hypothetical protein